MSERKKFVGPIMAIKEWLRGIQHNIGVYEAMSEYSIDPLDRKKTLDDLREAEAEHLEAIKILTDHA